MEWGRSVRGEETCGRGRSVKGEETRGMGKTGKRGGNLWFAFPAKGSRLETDLSESVGWATLVDSGWSKKEYFDLNNGWTAIKFTEPRI